MRKWERWLAGLVLIALLAACCSWAALQPTEAEVFEPVSFLAGGVVGYAIKGDGKVQPVSRNGALEELIANKPVTYEVLALDASTARDNKEFVLAGDYILIENYHSTVPFFIRLNEADHDKLNLAKHTAISGLFHRFYITNVAGNGNIVLKVCRGITLQPADTVSLAELAARLGSIVTFDRRGEVIWMDDFEDNIAKWLVSGTGATAALSTTTARNGEKSALLTTGAGLAAQIDHFMSYPVLSRMGFEASFTYDSDLTDLGWHIYLYDGVNVHYATVGYNAAATTLRIRDPNGNWFDIDTNVALYNIPQLFHTLKVVVDFTSDKYVRLILDNQEYDVSAYSLPTTTSSLGPHMMVRYAIFSAATGKTGYVDDAIVTQKEP